MCILPKISSHEDLLCLSDGERNQLCAEIREFLISSVSKTGGHLAGNLGAVELSVAIETVFNTSKDRLVFDVGHQSYVHKMLTGRRADFAHLRQYGGISGFPKPSESETDSFVAGHASSSVSIALGMAKARSMQGEGYEVVALIGDGAVTGGMAYEGLNNAAVSREPMVIILNDNEMSIGENVGGMSKHLSRIRSSENYLEAKQAYRKALKKLPGGRALYAFSSRMKNRVKRFLLPVSIFESMGFTYLGPADGHDLPGLIALLTAAKELQEPVLVHVVTKKGYGYRFAEEDPAKFHGIGKFDPESGTPLKVPQTTFSDVFGRVLIEIAAEDPKICAITAAMPGGTGLLPFKETYPNRMFDVGIAEEHAVSMAGGLAKQGMHPVVALYSTFLQRSYDMILQDICMLKLPVILAIVRAGLVGEDGETHHGIYDVGFLRHAPGMQILCPASLCELESMLRWSAKNLNGPVAIRYPRGGNGLYCDNRWNTDSDTICMHRTGKDLTIITYGTLINNAIEAAEILSHMGIEVSVLRLMCINPVAVEDILKQVDGGKPVFVVEEAAGNCGIYEHISSLLHEAGFRGNVYGLNLGNQYIPHGNVETLYDQYGLSPEKIVKSIVEVHQNEK